MSDDEFLREMYIYSIQKHNNIINRINETAYLREDCNDLDLARYMAICYISYYATKRRLGHVPTDEDRARIWNGGPDGWKEEGTKGYWEKVKRELERIAATTLSDSK